jgi:adenylate cyclase class 2
MWQISQARRCTTRTGKRGGLRAGPLGVWSARLVDRYFLLASFERRVRSSLETMARPERRNVELKARDPDPDATLAACLSVGAADQGVLWQRDSYFPVARGRLKLREQTPGAAHLIQYARADAAHERLSSYRIVEVADPTGLLSALEASLGLDVAVVKHRRLLLWETVRIHLDTVEGLGSFVELEAVAPPESDLSAEYRMVAELRAHLGITDDRLCERGYAQLLRTA